MTVFIPFWQLRRAAVAEEAVRGGSKRPRVQEPWLLAAEIKGRLAAVLVEHGLDPSQEILVEERPGEDGFRFSQ